MWQSCMDVFYINLRLKIVSLVQIMFICINANYRVLRKFEDIKLSVITSAVTTIQSLNFIGFKNYSISRYPQCYNFYNRT